MAFIIEAVVFCLIFTLSILISFKKNPYAGIDDFPPSVGKYVREHNFNIPEIKESRKARIIRKSVGALLIVIILGLMVKFINKADTFFDGFIISYSLWTIGNLYDLFIIDWILCTFVKRLRIPGTEEMGDLYKGFWFHTKKSLIGVLLGLPLCALVGLVVMLL